MRRWGGQNHGIRPMGSRELLLWCRERRGRLAEELVTAERLPSVRVLRAVAERLELDGDAAGCEALRIVAKERFSLFRKFGGAAAPPAPANGDVRRVRVLENGKDGLLYVRVPVSTMYGLLAGDEVELRFRHDVVTAVRVEVDRTPANDDEDAPARAY